MKQEDSKKETLSSCFSCGADSGSVYEKSGSVRPLFIADANQIIQADLVQFRQTDGKRDRQLPYTLLVTGIHIAVAAEIVSHLANGQVVVCAQILQSLIFHCSSPRRNATKWPYKNGGILPYGYSAFERGKCNKKENGLYFFHNFFIEKPGKGVDKAGSECYLKSIDVSTPPKRVLTGLYNRKELISVDTELDERKRKILKAIIQTYLETGEPVGSRTISKYTDLNLSSATIRNEMSDLEEMGYILQPHTSAGRIPSDKGYRLYVDELMQEKEQEVADIKNMVIEKTDRMEKVLQQVVRVLASSTNYATLITGPEYHRNKVKFIQLSKVNEEQLLAVIVVEGNLVKNQMIDLDETINDEQILKLNLLLNTQLNGLTIEEINLGMIKKMKEQAGIHSGIISKVVDTVAEAIAVSEEDVPVYTSGATNIFKYPELSDSSKASQLISTFEERKKLVDMIKGASEEQDGEENTGIQVYIGNESSMEPLKDCSVVTTTYDMGNGMRGTIGIVGPKRMDYENVVDNLKTLKVQLDAVFKKPGTDQ